MLVILCACPHHKTGSSLNFSLTSASLKQVLNHFHMDNNEETVSIKGYVGRHEFVASETLSNDKGIVCKLFYALDYGTTYDQRTQSLILLSSSFTSSYVNQQEQQHDSLIDNNHNNNNNNNESYQWTTCKML